MYPKDIIDKVSGLTRDQLSYYVKTGYLKPKKFNRGKNAYTKYSNNDLLVIEKAYYYIAKYGTKPKTAFEKARSELKKTKLKSKIK